METMSLVIQAGGRSSRMGREKGVMPFLGRPLIARIVERLEPAGGEVLVVTNRPELYAFLGRRMVPDRVPGAGPLGGLLTALYAANFPLVANVACDLPFASVRILELGRRALTEEPEMDVFLPRSSQGLEPLHAIYRKATCLPAVERALHREERRMISWLHAVRIKELPPDEIAKLDPLGLAFHNLNTPEEVAVAEEQARKTEGQMDS